MDQGTRKRFNYICNEINPFSSRDNVSVACLSDEDHAWLVYFCEFHGLRGELLRDRRGRPHVSDWTSVFRPWARRYAFRTLQMVGEIAALAESFAAAGIDAIFFKGAVLGAELYGGAQYREYADIDVLVAPALRQEAAAAAAKLGYQPVILDEAMREAFFDQHGQHMHHNPETGLTLDLHWRFVGVGPFPVKEADVLRNRTALQLGGCSVPVPCVEDLALILAGHGQKEAWASFSWALDFAKFANCYPEFDWGGAAARAEAQNCVGPLLAAAALVDRLFGYSIDARLVARAKGLRHVGNQVDAVVNRYALVTEREAEDDLKSAYRLCDTRMQKAKVLFSLLFSPTIGDFEAVPLRPPLWWAYPLIRPLRLGWRKASGTRRVNSAFWIANAQAAKDERRKDRH